MSDPTLEDQQPAAVEQPTGGAEAEPAATPTTSGPQPAPAAHSPSRRPAGAKRPRRFLRWLIPLAAVVVIAGVVGGILIANHAKTSSNRPQTITRDVTAQTMTMSTTIAATGTIEPARRADLSFSSAGTVTAVEVAVGDAVTSGQVLATIDTTDLQAAVDSAQAAVDAATSDYNDAVSGGVTAQINAAKSTLTAKQNSLTNAQTALNAATMTAPFDGTVAIMTMAVGDTVGSGGVGGSGGSFANTGSSSTSSDTITVISTDLYSVSTSVGASDVQQLAKGMVATVTPNNSTTAMDGTVSSVGVIASSSTSSGATFPVTIDITDPQPGLYAGVSAAITITLSSQDVVAVPTAAVSQTAGQATVELVNGDTTTTTAVTTGDRQDGMVAITSGLQAGDTVRVTMTFGGTTTGGNAPSGFSTLFGSGLGGFGGNGGGNFPNGGQMPDFGNGQGPVFVGGQQLPNDAGQGNG